MMCVFHNTVTLLYLTMQTVIMMLSCIYTTEGVHVPQQEEAGNDGAAGDGSVAPDPSTAIPGEMVLGSYSSSMSKIARNMVGLPTCTLYTGKMVEEYKSVPVDEDSEERKEKAMKQVRKVSAYNCLFTFVVRLV